MSDEARGCISLIMIGFGLFVLPVLVIWALNGLFGLYIPFGFRQYFSAMVFCAIFGVHLKI